MRETRRTWQSFSGENKALFVQEEVAGLFFFGGGGGIPLWEGSFCSFLRTPFSSSGRSERATECWGEGQTGGGGSRSDVLISHKKLRQNSLKFYDKNKSITHGL